MVVVPARCRALALGVTLALLAGLVACTSDEPAAAPVRTTAEQIWTTAGLEPVSAVRNVGGVAVVYGTTPGGLVHLRAGPGHRRAVVGQAGGNANRRFNERAGSRDRRIGCLLPAD